MGTVPSRVTQQLSPQVEKTWWSTYTPELTNLKNVPLGKINQTSIKTHVFCWLSKCELSWLMNHILKHNHYQEKGSSRTSPPYIFTTKNTTPKSPVSFSHGSAPPVLPSSCPMRYRERSKFRSPAAAAGTMLSSLVMKPPVKQQVKQGSLYDTNPTNALGPMVEKQKLGKSLKTQEMVDR